MKLFKSRGFVHAFVGVTALFLVSSAFGSNVTFNLDENCNGTLVSDSNTFIVPCSLTMDPVSGVTTVLYHLLGANGGLISGDVYIRDSISQLSDLLRFNADLGGVFAFSNDTGDLADVGIPFPDAGNPNLTIDEVDLGGGIIGVNYQPLDSTMPGLLAINPGGVTYSFVSPEPLKSNGDAPEPATYLLIGGSLLLLSLRRRKLRTF